MNIRTNERNVERERKRERERERETARSRKRRRVARIIRTCEYYSRGITRRGEGGSHSAGSHFHGVAVTEIKMVAGALLPPYSGLTANVSAPYMAAVCAPRERARTYIRTVPYIKRTLRACTCTAAQVAVPHVDRSERIDRSVL
jgi:hypothetical protein